jgi:creatinine amidohydrolase/Fe(II)-dependent formamide hydrolase-like protein
MNKLIEWAAVGSIALAMVVGAFAQAEHKNNSKEAVTTSLIEMERQWSESANPTDEIRVVQKIFAEDFLGTDTDGKLYTKSEKIAEEKARTSTGEVLSPHLDEVKVRFFGDNLAVLYGHESSIRKSKEGKEYTRRVIWTDTWLKRDGRWQIIAVQDMVAQPSVAPPSPAQSESALIEDLTWTEVRDAIGAGKTTAIYYAGSTEQNGPHMALGKHNFIARYVSQRIAEKLGNALVYPVMPFGPTGDIATKTDHMHFPGSVSVSQDTFGAVAREVALSAIAAGFKNVVLMGDHGGDQEAMKKVAEGLDNECSPKGIHVHYIPDLYYKEKEQMREYLTKRNMAIDQHAGIDDTSEVMFIDMDGKWIRKDKLAPDNGKMGVEGDPTRASPELGKMFIDFKIQDAVAQIRSLVEDRK